MRIFFNNFFAFPLANDTNANTSYASVCGNNANVTVLSKKNSVTLEYMIEPGVNSGFTANYSVGKC